MTDDQKAEAYNETIPGWFKAIPIGREFDKNGVKCLKITFNQYQILPDETKDIAARMRRYNAKIREELADWQFRLDQEREIGILTEEKHILKSGEISDKLSELNKSEENIQSTLRTVWTF